MDFFELTVDLLIFLAILRSWFIDFPYTQSLVNYGVGDVALIVKDTYLRRYLLLDENLDGIVLFVRILFDVQSMHVLHFLHEGHEIIGVCFRPGHLIVALFVSELYLVV